MVDRGTEWWCDRVHLVDTGPGLTLIERWTPGPGPVDTGPGLTLIERRVQVLVDRNGTLAETGTGPGQGYGSAIRSVFHFLSPF